MSWGPVVILSVLVLIVTALRALQALRHTRGTERGSHPGKGYHVIEANYFSGGGGGGQSGEIRVPRDPQEYAKTFIPRDRKND